MLFHKGWVIEDIVHLLRFMDWVLTLPVELEEKLVSEIQEQEGVQKVEYLSNIERWSIEKGMQQGILQGMQQGILQHAREAVLQVLQVKFHSTPLEVSDAIGRIDDTATLNNLLTTAVTTNSLDEFRQSLAA